MKWFIALLVAAVVAGLTAWIWMWMAESRRDSNERAASAALKTLASAEADFRANDRDGNRIQDFWTGDVARLYYLPDPLTGLPMKLIEKSIADADAKPLQNGATPPVPGPRYFFIAMEVDESENAYAQDTQGTPNRGPHFNQAKFAYCAYPADYPRSGKWTFIINENNTIFKLDTGGRPVLVWPSDDWYCKKCLQKPHPGSTCSWALQ